MSKLIDIFGDLGTAAGTAGAAYLSIPEEQRRQKLEEEERAYQLKQRARQDALTQYKLAQALTPGLLASGQSADAARIYNEAMGVMGGAGLPHAAPVVGGLKEIRRPDLPSAEAPRPAPDFVGPMPARQDAEAAATIKMPTFDNPQTLAAIRGGLGIQAPKPESFELAPGHSRYTLGADGRPELAVTAPATERTTAPRLVKTWDPAVGGYRMVPAAADTIIMPEPDKPRVEHERPVDPLVQEQRLIALAKQKYRSPYPVDAKGGGRKGNEPDGIADNYPGVKMPEAVQAWEKGLDDLTESLRKTGGRTITPRPSGQPRRPDATEDGRSDPFGPPAGVSAAPASFTPGTGGTARWAPVIETAAARHGVHPQLVQAVMAQESGGNPNAVSPAGARGLMQFMPATAKGYGINPDDPEQAIDAGAKMLSGLVKQYGSVPLALAAYNAGSGNVAEYGGKIPPFPETIAYVAKITKRLGMEFDPAWVAPRHDGKPIKWPPGVRPREQNAAAPYDVAIVSNNGGSRAGDTGDPTDPGIIGNNSGSRSGGMSPRLQAFYEKHGITPGGANA